MTELPDKDKLKDMLFISGNWEFGPGEDCFVSVPRREAETIQCMQPILSFLVFAIF